MFALVMTFRCCSLVHVRNLFMGVLEYGGYFLRTALSLFYLEEGRENEWIGRGIYKGLDGGIKEHTT